MNLPRALFLYASLALASPWSAHAQATLTGTARHDSSRAGLAGVDVLLDGGTQRTLTSSSGQYALTGLPPGTHTILFRSVGYRPLRIELQFRSGDTTRFDALLVRTNVQVLDSVAVTGRVTRGVGVGREAFEERRTRGFGRFVDTEELRRSENRRVSDMLRGMQGVRVVRFEECLGPNRTRCSPPEERAASGRGATSMVGRSEYCWMSIMLDGSWLYQSGSSGKVPDLSRDVRVRDLDMIEVYRSSAEVPGEYSGASAACGVILMWSRRSP